MANLKKPGEGSFENLGRRRHLEETLQGTSIPATFIDVGIGSRDDTEDDRRNRQSIAGGRSQSNQHYVILHFSNVLFLVKMSR